MCRQNQLPKVIDVIDIINIMDIYVTCMIEEGVNIQEIVLPFELYDQLGLTEIETTHGVMQIIRSPWPPHGML